jgi:putative FmdB family regulatory protein
MPTYSYQCPACETQFDRVLRLADHESPQFCECGCEDQAKRVISPVGFVLRGDGWTGKNMKIKGQMAKRRQRLAGKEHEQKMDGPGVRLAPNVNGERVDSWSEAKKLAKSQGKETSSYDSHIRTERQRGKRA